MKHRETGSSMQVEPTIDSVVFRVNLWSRPSPGYAWNLDGHLFFDADINAVLAWVRANGGGRRYEVFVEFPGDEPESHEPRSATLLRLYGADPNDPEDLSWQGHEG